MSYISDKRLHWDKPRGHIWHVGSHGRGRSQGIGLQHWAPHPAAPCEPWNLSGLLHGSQVQLPLAHGFTGGKMQLRAAMGTAEILLYSGNHRVREQGRILISRPVPAEAVVTTVLDHHTHSSSRAKG